MATVTRQQKNTHCKRPITFSYGYLPTIAKQPYRCYAMGIYHCGDTSCQVGHLCLIGTHYTILANQSSITDFCQGTLSNS